MQGNLLKQKGQNISGCRSVCHGNSQNYFDVKSNITYMKNYLTKLGYHKRRSHSGNQQRFRPTRGRISRSRATRNACMQRRKRINSLT